MALVNNAATSGRVIWLVNRYGLDISSPLDEAADLVDLHDDDLPGYQSEWEEYESQDAAFQAAHAWAATGYGRGAHVFMARYLNTAESPPPEPPPTRLRF